MSGATDTPKARLPLWRAAFVIARRDFVAVLFSRAFFFFLLGPLFPILVGGLAGGIGNALDKSSGPPEIGIAMTSPDVDAMLKAHGQIEPVLGYAMPPLRVLQRLAPGETFDAEAYLARKQGNDLALVSVSQRVHRVLELARLDKVFTLHADLAGALSGGRASGPAPT